ncbi:MAG: flagellar basal-body MS-ring/collar protein FliF [bacterium]|nr:flagellar basal-body MS-ring/collar protein FliF [bacterium]
MNEFLARLLQQFKTVWEGLTRNQRIVIISAVAVVGIALAGLIIWSTREEYVVLYSRIDTEEAGRITAKLNEWKQPFRLEGNTIFVPIKDKDTIRLNLASEKLAPTGGVVDFSIFDKVNLTTTDFERHVNFLRALQGELTRTIKSIDQIDDARIMIVMPKKDLYVEEEELATASIKLELSPYSTLDAGQVKGIVYLVASAVEGLSPENVTIVDQKGNILSDILGEDATPAKQAGDQLDRQREEGNRLARKIKQTLGRVLGPDKVDVIVKWEMNFDRLETKAKNYTKTQTGIGESEVLKISDEIEKEQFKGLGQKPEGPPGVESNIPTYEGITEAKGPLEYKRDEQRTNYVPNEEETLKIRAPATTKIAVAVFVDGIYERDKDGERIPDKETGLPIYKPRTEEEMTKYESLVRAAVGNEKEEKEEGRMYVVKVENVQFDRTQEWAWENKLKAQAARQQMMLYSLVGTILVVLVLFLVVKYGRRYLAERKRLKEEEARRRELEEAERTRLAAEEEEAEAQLAGLTPEERAISELQKACAGLAQDRPELVANLLRTWIAEEAE